MLADIGANKFYLSTLTYLRSKKEPKEIIKYLANKSGYETARWYCLGYGLDHTGFKYRQGEQIGFGAHPAYYTVSTVVISMAAKWLVRVDPTLPIGDEVKVAL
jgi:hypothetical protein